VARAIIVVLAIGLTASFAPSSHASSKPAHMRGPIVALGDSYIAGIGAGLYTEQHGCRRSSVSYPRMLAHRTGALLVDLSCPGETIDGTQRKVEQLPKGAAIVLIQIGGNDIDFTNLAGSCFIASRATCHRSISSAHRHLESMSQPLVHLLRSVRNQAPHARVVLMGYPLLIGSPARCSHLLPTDRSWAIRALQRRLDRTLEHSAVTAQTRFLDWPILVDRHSLCSKDPWYALPGDRLEDVLHPDRRATAAAADRLWRSLR
jgi:hypothetical protein